MDDLVLLGLIVLIVAATAGPYRYTRRSSRMEGMFADLNGRLQLGASVRRSF